MAHDKHEKTEKPTERRKDKARRKGQVVKSNELKSALMVLAGAILLKMLGPWFETEIIDMVTCSLAATARQVISVETAPEILGASIQWTGKLLAPVFVAFTAVAICVNALIQGGLVLSTQSLKIDLNRINPVSGASRMFSSRMVMKLALDLVKVILVGLVCVDVVRKALPVFMNYVDVGLGRILANVGCFTCEVLFKAGGILLVLGVIDYAYQRAMYQGELKMSKREIKDEHKETEGDPIIKGRIKATQRAMARRRMMAAIPEAQVVLTNPTEIAVALKYDAATMNAPQVVAKGKRLLAEKIKAIAETHDIPIVENKPLAQSLYRLVQVGEEIPAELYRAVAEVLSYVYRLRGRLNQIRL